MTIFVHCAMDIFRTLNSSVQHAFLKIPKFHEIFKMSQNFTILDKLIVKNIKLIFKTAA